MKKCAYAKLLETAPGIDVGLGTRITTDAFKAVGHTTGRTSITRHRNQKCICYGGTQGNGNTQGHPATADVLSGKVDVGADGGEFIDVQAEERVEDWDHVFQRFNLDPTIYEIIDDTVRCSTWQQSKALEDGTRDIVNLYSYRARFRRKPKGYIDTTSLIEHIRTWKPTTPTPNRVVGAPLSYVVGMADFQLGKGEGDGTPGTLRRLENALNGIAQHIEQLRHQGLNLKHLALVNLGDHIENVAGSYASQTHTVDMNMRDQLKTALDVNMAWIKRLVPHFETATYAACNCNHGQLSRGQGRDNVTDDADNATGLIGDTLQTICALHPDLEHIDWQVPRGEMLTLFTASGANIVAAHGHKISGKEEDWLARQSQYLTQAKRFIPDIWFTAHKHHADIKDYGPYSRIQATTVDPGSKYYLDQTGMYSRPGVTTFVAGESLPGKWDHHRIF